MTDEQFERLMDVLSSIDQKLDFIDTNTSQISSISMDIDAISKAVREIKDLQ